MLNNIKVALFGIALFVGVGLIIMVGVYVACGDWAQLIASSI